jgi:hypothetical protein
MSEQFTEPVKETGKKSKGARLPLSEVDPIEILVEFPSTF